MFCSSFLSLGKHMQWKHKSLQMYNCHKEPVLCIFSLSCLLKHSSCRHFPCHSPSFFPPPPPVSPGTPCSLAEHVKIEYVVPTRLEGSRCTDCFRYLLLFICCLRLCAASNNNCERGMKAKVKELVVEDF